MVDSLEGSHTFKWAHIGGEYGYNISHFKFEYEGEVEMNDCNDVYLYGFNYAGDLTGDCRVDVNDFALLVEDWLNCYNPDPNVCP